MSTPEDNELLEIDKNTPVPIFQAHKGGCPRCMKTGYKGRTAIHEILLATPTMKEIIAAGAKSEQIQELARKEGCLLLRDNVSKLVQQGVTDMGELIRVTYAV